MAEQITSLEELGQVAGDELPAAEPETPREPVRDNLGRSYATGKRKDAVARVWIKPGSGKFLIRDAKGEYIDYTKYFARPVSGGGLSGQAGAVKHGVSKALQLYDPTLRGALKAAGFLTRDSRVVERKKYGKAKARKSFQFSKR